MNNNTNNNMNPSLFQTYTWNNIITINNNNHHHHHHHHHNHDHHNHNQIGMTIENNHTNLQIFSSSSLLSNEDINNNNNEDQEEEEEEEPLEEELGAMKEMMYKIAAMQPVDIDPATIKKPKRKNVRISDDPQSVAARHRRERISERIRILQRLVPGGTKMDTASMLDEAIRYVKFLKRQIRLLNNPIPPTPPRIPLLPPPPPPSSSLPEEEATTWSTESVLRFGV